MLHLYIFAFLAAIAHGRALDLSCNDGQNIHSELIHSPANLIGNWSYVYHWDNIMKLSSSLQQYLEKIPKCSQIDIEPATLKFLKKKLKKCGDKVLPFTLEDAKLKLKSMMVMKDHTILYMGEKDSWIIESCKKMYRVEVRQVSADVMLIVNPDVSPGHPDVVSTEMFMRKPVGTSELNCFVRNVDVGKDMSGIVMCAE